MATMADGAERVGGIEHQRHPGGGRRRHERLGIAGGAEDVGGRQQPGAVQPRR